ncbi:cytochrome p450 monooxygenase [Pyrenophora seminiperda CCB06]|uniref:Cytochrome p450 monooxygenase n=1 Tax=Pyrenophora seminiperda CCB06 TaxID=1302712 RepID=A0A3M7M5A3_9PLEO|nr:cytochrome p450 monooxygenase [Pyrenophora seminiperda CCB06]
MFLALTAASLPHTTTMGALNLIPLVILFAVVGGIGWVGYQIYLYSNELAERGVKKMEKKNVVFTKDGAKVGVKEVSTESYTDKTQRAFVKTWNAAQDGDTFFWAHGPVHVIAVLRIERKATTSGISEHHKVLHNMRHTIYG